MKLQFLLVGAAMMAMSAPAFAQDTPSTAPGAQPAPAMQPATPMPPPSTTMTPDQPTATPPNTSDSTTTADPAAKPTYGKGWNAKKCEAAQKSGKTVDPANCPPPKS